MFCKFCIPKFYANISRHIPLAEGRIEMLRYLQEQSLFIDYHRYGNMGEREFWELLLYFSENAKDCRQFHTLSVEIAK